MIHYINFRQLIIHQNALSYAHQQLKTTELPIFPLRSLCYWAYTCGRKHSKMLGLIPSVLDLLMASLFFPTLLKCRFSPLAIDLHICYFVCCSAVLCFSWSITSHFSMIIDFRKKYFWVPSVSFSPSDCSTCFGDSISLQ